MTPLICLASLIMDNKTLSEDCWRIWILFLKVGHSRPLFIYFCLFNKADSKQVKNVQILPMTKFEPRTSGMRKRPLYQLSHNHCPRENMDPCDVINVKFLWKPSFVGRSQRRWEKRSGVVGKNVLASLGKTF